MVLPYIWEIGIHTEAQTLNKQLCTALTTVYNPYLGFNNALIIFKSNISFPVKICGEHKVF